jgi:hypothetical protein
MKRFLVIFGIIFFIIFSINAEKWVGQVATYNLIDGSQIADGGIFNADNVSAACNGFKLGTSVMITNVKTGQKLAVKINDRVKNDSDYFMLLTPKAAKDLGLSWETSLVVVEADFSNINSTEILNISGLVAEGAVDPEKFKKFPDVNWPDNGKEISSLAVEKDEKTVTPEEKIITGEKITEVEKAEKLNEPVEEKKLSPDTIMKMYVMDKDAEDNFLPKIEFFKEPAVKEKSMGEDKEDKTLPRNETVKIPEFKDNIINEDIDELLIPKKELVEVPGSKENALGEDVSDNLMPKSEIVEEPEKIGNEIDRDTGVNEKEDVAVSTVGTEETETETEPIDTDNGVMDAGTSSDKVPSVEFSKKPLSEEKEMDMDTDKFVMIKEKQNKGIVATGKIEKGNWENEVIQKYNWTESLAKSKIYIRFSATYEKEEGERRINIFKQVFRNVIGLKENNKFILLIGPLEKKDVDKTLKGIRSFGYIDAYIIQK